MINHVSSIASMHKSNFFFSFAKVVRQIVKATGSLLGKNTTV